MKKVFIFATLMGSILVSGVALANTTSGSDYGTVTKLDRAGQSITLANGDTYNVLFADELRAIKVGEKAEIMFNNGDAISVTRSF